ncbi:MAG TPA: myxosortase-dependent M36 family metallopeptidase [Archangium sp.]|nr:myxosortase-dependent M36 family metallopeptidase [Archangium sp.]
MRRLVATLSGLSLVLSGTSAVARTLPNYDALQDAKPAGRVAAGFKPVNSVTGARVSHRDALTGSPTFIWVNKDAEQTKLRAQFASMAPEQAALAQAANHAPLLGLTSFEAAGARVVSVDQNGQGVKIVKMAQESGGIEVFRQNLNLLLNRNNELVAISGALSNQVSTTNPEARLRFQLPATEAISVAYKDLTGNVLDASLLTKTNVKQETGPYAHYALATYARPLEQGLVIPARVKQVLYPLPTALVPAYYVELNTGAADSKDSDYYSYVVSAVDGTLLMRNNLTSHAEFSYRVFAEPTPPYTPYDGPAGTDATPHPTGNPDGYRPQYVRPALITLQNAPFSKNDPWLPDNATVTSGNNVDAYADLVAPDGFQEGDLRPTTTTTRAFDREMLFDIAPNANPEQIAAATTSLFYMNNWLHDWYYDAGFNEASGNAQNNNFGRGGLGNDAIRAQAQDYSGINNANMSTPADGAPPRMQMYIFSGPRNARLTVKPPASIAGDYKTGVAAGFGPQTFDVTGDVVAALDAANPTGPSTTDGCTALTNAAEVAGKIALIDRGTCGFVVKMENAQTAGAIGVIIADNAPGFVTDMGGTATNITIPSLRLTQADGNRVRAALAQGVNAQMFRGPTTNLDGTVDNAIVAHEWGHYISNRLIANSAGLVNNQGRAMGEGWSDFHALLMMVREGDINVQSNANWMGVYAMAEYATRGISPDAAFFGIRRGAYSVDETKNALRFRHIMDGVPLPDTTPFVPGGANSQVHNSGEVWASTLWECYVALLREHPFQEAQKRMKQYLVNGYKLTPPAPTFLEARDAILAAAYASSSDDFQRLWAAFARRGMGVGAVAPARFSTNHAGVVESYKTGVDVVLVSASFEDTGSGDKDGILDNGETGNIAITVSNTGSAPAKLTSATVVSTTPGVTVLNRGTVTFPEIPVGGTVKASVPVSLTGASLAQRVDFIIAIRDDGQALPGDKAGALAFKVHYDEKPLATTTETVEASDKNLPWTPSFDPALAVDVFEPVEFPDLNRALFGPSLSAASDIRLMTPELQVDTTQPFSLTFSHSYDFEADFFGTNYDGAVIELSENDGQTWVDIGESAYNGVLAKYDGNLNPLAGRRAFVRTTPGFPAFTSTTLNLGNTYAGKTVRIRFRIGTDNSVAFTGWVLDNLSFSGITNRPFTKICADNGQCDNSAPVVNAGPDLTVDERAQVSLKGTAYDVDGNALTYEWTRVSGPLGVTLTGADTLTPSFTAPEVTANATLVLRLTVRDGTGPGSASASDTVSINIRQVNRAPTVNAGPAATVDERSTVTLSASASDPDNTPLTYLWTQVSGTPVGLRDYTKATATFIAPEVALDETLTFRVTVSDGQASADATVAITIRQVNRAPTVNAGLDAIVDERSTATLSASASDSDGTPLTYLWTQVSGTPVVLRNPTQATAIFDTPEVALTETLTFSVTVSDGEASTSDTVDVLVRNVNRAPMVMASSVSVDERSTATLMATGSDADGDPLTYSWTQLTGDAVVLSGADSATATFSTAEVPSDAVLTFRVTVNDGTATATQDVVVNVRNVNRAPTVNAGADGAANEGTTVTLSGSASDADGDALTYHWVQVSGTPVALSNGNAAVATFTAPKTVAGETLSFVLTVSDGKGTVSDTVSVSVSPANTAPVANARILLSGNQTAMTLDGTASIDPDGDALTYKWEQTGGPTVALNNATQAVLNVDVPEFNGESATFSFKLTVTDARGGSHSVTVETSAKPDRGGGCSSTGAGAPVGMLGLALLSLLRRRRNTLN